MSIEGERFMRILVFFDLPTLTKKDRKTAGKFRRFLIQDGYNMLQLSVYSRICKGEDTLGKHINRLESAVPEKGNVRVLKVTEMQYSKMKLLVGSVKKGENFGEQQLLLF